MRAKDALGRWGEDLAVNYLETAGLTILARNWRCPLGELDVVAREGNSLVVCEVKTRRSDDYGGPFQAVTPRKVRRLRQLVVRWLDENQVHAPAIRFDVIGIIAPHAGQPTLHHLRGIQ